MMRALTAIAAVVLATMPVRAQEPGRPLPAGTAVGGSIGAFLVEDEPIYTIALNVSELRARRVGMDFTLSLPPNWLRHGALILAADVAAAYNLALPGATLLLKAGPSLIAGCCAGVGGVLIGGQGGLGLIIQAGPNVGLRLDLSERVYFVDARARAYAIPSLSLGITALAVAR